MLDCLLASGEKKRKAYFSLIKMARARVCVRLQSGELPILGDQPEQGGLAAGPSER